MEHNVMRLYIGKNHDEKDASVPVQSIFRLAGSDEDALTYALGFLLARDPIFCVELVRLCGVKAPQSFKHDYAVHLQEVTDPRYGRRDIVIEAGKVRIVLEAKIGRAEPTADQLLKYVADDAKWANFTIRAVVALTQVELLTATRDAVVSKLTHKRIRFSSIQWHQIIELAFKHRQSDDSAVPQYLFDEFISYIRRDYDMGYYDAEVMVQDVNPLNAKIFEESWMYVTALKDKKAPLYFAPYFTKKGANSGISMISRVMDTKTVKLADEQDVAESATDEQRGRWGKGLRMLQERAEKEGFSHGLVRLFFLDRPIAFRSMPLSKKAFKATGPSKRVSKK
jgi:hypothetical protein